MVLVKFGDELSHYRMIVMPALDVGHHNENRCAFCELAFRTFLVRPGGGFTLKRAAPAGAVWIGGGKNSDAQFVAIEFRNGRTCFAGPSTREGCAETEYVGIRVT